jgi:hypothetical protein
VQPRLLEGRRVGGQLVVLAAGLPSAAKRPSAASMPVLMAAWLPLMREAFR